MDISIYEQGKHIVLEIGDTGLGIPEENLERIFEPEFTTKGDKGTGLGLVISKNIIEENDGEISVESKIDVGTKFAIRFPTYSNPN